MATANQINYRLTQAKSKLAILTKEVKTTMASIKKLESEFKEARIALIAQAAEKRKIKRSALADNIKKY
ncbi:MAG: hypothetical protein JXL81_06060 [Deltaproteobacteria bacterium]|nr:hypothetical protein [Deltaproteobacteria bacterium]